MFYGCSSLLSIPEFSKWNTNNVTSMILCLVDVHPYHLYLIFQNGKLIMLLIFFLCLVDAQILYFQKNIKIIYNLIYNNLLLA